MQPSPTYANGAIYASGEIFADGDTSAFASIPRLVCEGAKSDINSASSARGFSLIIASRPGVMYFSRVITANDTSSLCITPLSHTAQIVSSRGYSGDDTPIISRSAFPVTRNPNLLPISDNLNFPITPLKHFSKSEICSVLVFSFGVIYPQISERRFYSQSYSIIIVVIAPVHFTVRVTYVVKSY